MVEDNNLLKKHLKEVNNDGSFNPAVYKFVFFLVRLLFGSKPKPEFILNDFDKVNGPYILLSNHESFYDFYYLYQLPHKKKPVYVINRYYYSMPFLRLLSRKAGMIPKKLFNDDMVTPVRIMRTLKNGRPVIIYPEGRLSIDGRTNRIAELGGAFYKRLGVDIVLARVNGAFYEKPKWRKRRYHTPVTITVAKVITREQAASMSAEELNKAIADTTHNDASRNLLCKYPQKDKAEGLHSILYRCYSCDGLYTTSSKGNTITCSKCGKTFTLGEDYQFIEEPHTIAAWYDHMTEVEKKAIRDIDLKADVTTVIYSNTGKKRREKGKCHLTYEGFTYESENVSFHYPMDKIQGIPFQSGQEFELYNDDDLYYFYPDENPSQVARWAHIVDIIKTLEEKTGE